MSRKPKQQADDFVAANNASLVVYGSVIGNGGEGAYFRLDDGSVHRLGVEACKLLPHDYPKWRLS